jgi:hypothetical protein
MVIRTIFLLLVLPLTAPAQPDADELSDIRERYVETERQLNNCALFEEKAWKEHPGHDQYTPDIRGYYSGDAGTFIKLEETGEGQWLAIYRAYYLEDGELFFCYEAGHEAMEFYSADEMDMTAEEFAESPKEARTLRFYERRIYIAYGEIIKVLVKEKVLPPDTGSYNFDQTGSEVADPAEYDILQYMERAEKLMRALR